MFFFGKGCEKSLSKLNPDQRKVVAASPDFIEFLANIPKVAGGFFNNTWKALIV